MALSIALSPVSYLVNYLCAGAVQMGVTVTS